MLEYYGFVVTIYFKFYSTLESYNAAKQEAVKKLSWLSENKFLKKYKENLKSFKTFLTQIGISNKLEMDIFSKGIEEQIIEKIGCYVEVNQEGDIFKF